MSEVIIDKVKFKNVPDKRYGTKVNDILTQSNIGISADVAAYIQSQDFYTLVNGIDIDWNGIEVEDGLVLNTTADLINWIKTNGGGSAVEQIQSDWNQQDSTKKDFIKNKPTIPTPIDAYTKTEVNTLLDGKIDTTLKGAKNGVASLDSTGKVPASQLPSYVDDVIEGYLDDIPFVESFSELTRYYAGNVVLYLGTVYRFKVDHAPGIFTPGEVQKIEQFHHIGEAGKIYLDIITSKTYCWSGSAYTQIKGDLVIGTTQGTAFDGAAGAALQTQVSGITTQIEQLSQDVERLDQVVEEHGPVDVESLNQVVNGYGPVNGLFDGAVNATGRNNDYSNWWAPNVYHLNSGETVTIKRIIALTDIGLFKAVKINIDTCTIVSEIFETNITSAGVHIIDIPDTILQSNELIALYVKPNGETPTCKFAYKLDQSEELAANQSLYELYCSNSETPNQLTIFDNYIGCKLSVQFLTNRDFTEPTSLPSFQALPAQLIYNVYVDVPSLKPYQTRNYQACVYLDHLLNGLTSEQDIRFDNNKDRIQKNIPIYCSVYGKLPDDGSYIAIEGNNFKEYQSNHIIKAGNTSKLTFILKNRCIKSSVGKSFVPKVLCIGDSITDGVLSETKENNFAFRNTYVDICRQLFWKDQIDNNTQSDYKYIMIGTHTRDKQFTYNGNTYSFKVFHEGYPGYSASDFLNGNVPAFKKSDNEPFSISAYIEKYRTLDDDGNQLYFGANQETTGTAGENNAGYLANGQLAKDSQGNQIYIGTAVSNVESYSVCKPTHILINLGTNSPTTTEQWQQFVNLIHAEYSDIYIGLSVFDTSGTYFPSIHPNYSDSFAYWNQIADNQEVGASQNVSDHDKQWQTQNNLQSFFDKENEKVYVVPFFYCTTPIKTSVVREFESTAEELIKDDDLRNVAYGWGGNYHLNALGHAQCAYQLYGWIKWTLASL